MSLVLMGVISCGGGSSKPNGQGGSAAGGRAAGSGGTTGQAGAGVGGKGVGGAIAPGGSTGTGTGGAGGRAATGTGGAVGVAGQGGSAASSGGAGGIVIGVGGAGATAGMGVAGGPGTGTGGTMPATCVGRDIDVPNVIVSGTIKVGGVTVASTTDYGTLALRSGSDEVPLGATSNSSYSVRTIPGTYDLFYRMAAVSSAAPRNVLGTVKTGVVVAPSGTTAVDIDVPTATVSGMITIGGSAVTSTTDAGTVFLRNAGGDEVSLGATSAGSFLVRVTPGTYDVYYQAGTVGTVAPRNTAAKLKTGVAVAPMGTTSLDVDIPSVTLSGALTIGGAAAASATDAGTLYLRGAGSDQISLGSTSAGNYSVRVVPGTYELYYKAGTVGAVAPRNTNARLVAAVAVPMATSTVIDIDVPTSVVSGAITIAGAAATSTADFGTLYLRNATGDEVSLGTTYAGSYSIRVVPGTYDLYYKVGTAGSVAPKNISAKVKSAVVVAASGTTALDIDVPSVVVTGMMKIGGSAVTSTSDYGTLYLRNAAGDEAALGTTYSGSYSIRAVPGTYDIYYRVGTGGSFAPRNISAKIKSGTVLAVGGTTALDIDVPTALISGTIKIGGTSVTSTSDSGTLSLRDGKGDTFALGSTASGMYSFRVVPGTYDLFYSATTAGALAPRNTGAKLGCYQVP